ncbi:MAG: RNA polymerase sigma factor [bacterium]
MQDIALIQKAKAGDLIAFEQLIYRYDKQVLSLTARYVQSAEDAKDIYQEVFLRVFRSLPKFQFRSEFSTWLFRITTNVCLTHRSRKKRHPHTSLSDESDEEHGALSLNTLRSDEHTDESLERTEISLRVREAVDRLSAKQRLVFMMKYFEGYKIREIAVMMNCQEGTVKKYLFTAIRKLRNELHDLYEHKSGSELKEVKMEGLV